MPNLNLVTTRKFEKAFNKLCLSHSFLIDEIKSVILKLIAGESLGQEYRDHNLRGEMQGLRECHIRGDMLLIYRINRERDVVSLINLGTHSQLFD